MLFRSTGLAIILLFVGCDEDVRLGGNNRVLRQNGPRIIRVLSEAKDSCESLASIAKSQRIMLPKRRKEGRQLYGEARKTCNALIRELTTAINPTNSKPNRDEIHSHLGDVNEKCQAFTDWYRKEPDRPSTGNVAVSSTTVLPEFLSLAAEIVKLINQRNAIAAEERRVFREKLNECKWREWSELNQ